MNYSTEDTATQDRPGTIPRASSRRATLDLKRARSSKPKRGVLNRIHHMDFLESDGLQAGHLFDVVIADPPYNIGKDFGNDSDCRPMAEYIDWTRKWISLCMKNLSENGIVYVYGFPEILAHVAVKFPLEQQRWLVWHYTNKTVPRLQFWQRSHETILCLWKNSRPNLFVDKIREEYTSAYKTCIGKVRKGSNGRYGRTGTDTIYEGHENGALPRDVIKIPALAGGAGRRERWFLCHTCGDTVWPPSSAPLHIDHELLKHPTQKPMALTKRLIESVVNGNSILVPFAGSGSECVVAKALGKPFFATEINKTYVTLGNKWLAVPSSEICIT